MQSKHQVTVALCGLRRWIAELGLDEEEVAAAVVAAPRMLAMPLREAQENLSALAAALKLGVAEQGTSSRLRQHACCRMWWLDTRMNAAWHTPRCGGWCSSGGDSSPKPPPTPSRPQPSRMVAAMCRRNSRRVVTRQALRWHGTARPAMRCRRMGWRMRRMQVAAVARLSIVKHGIRSVVHLLIGHLMHFIS